MAVDFEFMKNSYECIKETTCDKCPTHLSNMIMSMKRTLNNVIFFCPTPEKKAEAKVKAGSGAWKKARAKAASK